MAVNQGGDMTQEEIRQLVVKNLIPFMSRFERDNHGGKISLEFIQGLGIVLQNLIIDTVQDALDQENAPGPLQFKPIRRPPIQPKPESDDQSEEENDE